MLSRSNTMTMSQKYAFIIGILCLVFLQSGLQLLSGLVSFFDEPVYYAGEQRFLFTLLYAAFVMLMLYVPKLFARDEYGALLAKMIWIATCIAMVVGYYSDLMVMFKTAELHRSQVIFVKGYLSYLHQEYISYLILIGLLCIIPIARHYFYSSRIRTRLDYTAECLVFLATSLLFLMSPLQWMNVRLIKLVKGKTMMTIPFKTMLISNGLYCACIAGALVFLYMVKQDRTIPIKLIKWALQAVFWVIFLFVGIQISMVYSVLKFFFNPMTMSIFRIFLPDSVFAMSALKSIPVVFLAVFTALYRNFLKKKEFDVTAEADESGGHFGTAQFADEKDLNDRQAFDAKNGCLIGSYNHHSIYLPTLNKLTISPPGGGKTTCSSIPILLSHDGSVFVFDIKGELWAVTARYRSEVLGRKVVVIDPFGVTKTPDFRQGKSDELLKEYTFNPFDWIPEDPRERDRMINAFASSFIITGEGGTAMHFDENAKILIRGYIDYLMRLDKSSRTLPHLHELMSEEIEAAMETLNEMSKLKGRAGAAANQINRVGADERGSILSTSYRQIDWINDCNVQKMLSESNFDLHEFVKGNMDIYVVLPEDQVKEHNRLFRMIMSLLMSLIVQTSPSALPKKKMLFLLEELAQLGACPDVEQCIEVMRTRGVIVWTVFQSLKQIELFDKPDLFLSVPLKQIFTNDDVKTMEWVQSLGGKKTIITKTLSTNTGDSRQKMQVFGGTASSGEGESVHETGVDLIQLNDIRELPANEQFVFVHGSKPIRCEKVRYFEAEEFKGKYDPNPLECKTNQNHEPLGEVV